MIDVRSDITHTDYFQSQMNFSPFQDEIFPTTDNGSALDIIGLSSSHIFKDSQSQCYDHFQNVYAGCTYSIMPETASTLSEKNVPNTSSNDDIFGWCTDEPRPSFSPTYNFTGSSNLGETYSLNTYQNTENIGAGAGAATLTLPVVQDTPTLILPGVENHTHFEGPVSQYDRVFPSVISDSSDSNFTTMVPKSQPSTPPHPSLTSPNFPVSSPSVPVSVCNNAAAALTATTAVPNSKVTDTSSINSINKPILVLSKPAFVSNKPTDVSISSSVSKSVSIVNKPDSRSVPSRPEPEGDLLSELTKEIIFSKSQPRSLPITAGTSILQSVYYESQQQNKTDGSEFLAPPPETAPAIPSLPQSLASKLKPEHKNSVIKFRRAYKRTTEKKPCDVYSNSDGEETGPSSNTRLAKQQKECLLDTIDDLYQREEIKGQQINVNVYRQIKSCNERDLGKGNYAGYVVSDASCFEGCKPFNGHRVKRNSDTHDEINVGTLASCKRLGVMRKVRTPDGKQVNVISPRPKYQIARSGSPKIVWPAIPKRVTPPKRVDVLRKREKFGCNTCDEKFTSCRLLFSHILKWHTTRHDALNI